MGHRKNFAGQYFWATGYYVSTVGRDEANIREYSRKHERVFPVRLREKFVADRL